MIHINTENCNGCGVCIDICPAGAISLIKTKACVDSNLCDECDICVDACPKGAIAHSRAVPSQEMIASDPIDIPAVVITSQDQRKSTTRQNAVKPVISSMLLWTGRELVPRLMNLALDYVEKRIQHPEMGISRYPNQDRHHFQPQAGGRRRRQRQRRRKNFQIKLRRNGYAKRRSNRPDG
jgi:ferredoxin